MNNDIHGGIISAYHVHCKYTRGFYVRTSNTLQLYTVELQWKVQFLCGPTELGPA